MKILRRYPSPRMFLHVSRRDGDNRGQGSALMSDESTVTIHPKLLDTLSKPFFNTNIRTIGTLRRSGRRSRGKRGWRGRKNHPLRTGSFPRVTFEANTFSFLDVDWEWSPCSGLGPVYTATSLDQIYGRTDIEGRQTYPFLRPLTTRSRKELYRHSGRQE